MYNFNIWGRQTMKIMLSKALVLAVIVLFIGAGVVPSISSNVSMLYAIESSGNPLYVGRIGQRDHSSIHDLDSTLYGHIHDERMNPISNVVDIAVTYGNSDDADEYGFSILLNDGDGSFYQRYDYDFEGGWTPGIVTYDFNDDRCNDIVVSTYYTDSIVVYLGDGKGGFIFHQRIFLEYMPNRLVVGDFNEDDIPDLAVTLQATGVVSILRGIGNGRFEHVNDVNVGDNPIGIKTDDFDLDGHLDLVIANTLDGDISILFGIGNGDFNNRIDYYVGDRCYLVSTGDFNLDGAIDLLVNNFHDDYVRVFLNDGNGDFLDQYDINVGAWFAVAIPVDDFNMDGFQDFAIPLYYLDENIVKVYYGNGNGGFSFINNYYLGNNVTDMISCDLNGDDCPDLLATNRLDHLICVRLNDGNGDFLEPIYFETGKYCFCIVAGDFTNILDNEPPNKPEITGPNYGKAGEEYDYTFNSVDPDGDAVQFYIEWGDGNSEWTGFNSSGDVFTRSHIWDEKDTYIIRAKAKDSKGAESDWATLEVSMPINKPYINSLFPRFLENHPHLFPLLRQLFGL